MENTRTGKHVLCQLSHCCVRHGIPGTVPHSRLCLPPLGRFLARCWYSVNICQVNNSFPSYLASPVLEALLFELCSDKSYSPTLSHEPKEGHPEPVSLMWQPHRRLGKLVGVVKRFHRLLVDAGASTRFWNFPPRQVKRQP